MSYVKDCEDVMGWSRRQFCRRLCAGIAAADLSDCAVSAVGSVVPVTDFGAKGDGIQDDRSAILRAIQAASQQPNALVFLPRGTYLLQHIAGGELLGLDGIRGLRMLGDQALLRCATPAGTTSVDSTTRKTPSVM